MKVQQIAKVCHEVNRAIQAHNGEQVSPPFDEAPGWQIASAIEGVERALRGATPEQLHESWMAAKIRDGWTYGLFKDESRRTHPCIVPYAELPEGQRLKDATFGAVVNAMKGAA